MSKRTFVTIPVDGPLDTANPSTNRPAGSWLKTVDQAHQSIGPRRGGKQQTWVGRLPSTVGTPITGGIPQFTFDGTNTYVIGTLSSEQGRLSNRWTLDVAFHAFAARTTANAVPVFQWGKTTVYINVGFYGSTHATPNKVYAIVKTTDYTGAVVNTYTLVGGTVNFGAAAAYTAGGKIVRTFVRLIRDGTTLTLLDSTGTTASTTLVATEDTGIADQWLYSKDTDLAASTSFSGYVLRVVLRDSVAPASVYPPATEHIFPMSPSVRFFGTTKYSAASGIILDHSMHGSTGVVSSAGGGGSADAGARHPFAKTVQGLGTFINNTGVATSMVMVGGVLCHQRVR